MTNSHNSSQPWYVKTKSKQGQRSLRDQQAKQSNRSEKIKSYYWLFLTYFFFFLSVFVVLVASFSNFRLGYHWLSFLFAFVFFVLSILSIFKFIGKVCSSLVANHADLSHVQLGIKYLQGLVQGEEARQGIPAPEMALFQFVQQVRSYATEKSFLRQKQEKNLVLTSFTGQTDPSVILKRRWNDVVDSLNEFEIYLANDPAGIIEKLVSQNHMQTTDVSEIFRDVAETFDTTWRRKGINIEQAIVTPLKANTNEALLRRLLVGPWRTCVYFARRGNEVIFSAKTVNGKVSAHWECEGVAFSDGFYQTLQNPDLSVNTRIEQAMIAADADTSSSNILFALISFVTWLDLANAAGCDYTVKQGTDGLIIELRI